MHTCPAVPALRRLIFRGVRRLFALPQGITQGKRQQRKSGERRQKDDPRADQGIWRPILLFNSGLDSISSKGKDLQAKMTEMLGKDEVSPEDMMALQFEVGQYNAMLESLSSVTKSMTDMMKSLAQRTG